MYTYGHTMSLHDALPIWQILLVLAVLLLLPMPVLDDDAFLIVIKVHRRAALGALPVLDGLARALAGWPLALVRRRRPALAPGIDIAVELRGLAVVDGQIPVAERGGLSVAPNSRLFRHLATPPRTEARGVGKECISPCRSRGSPVHSKTQPK